MAGLLTVIITFFFAQRLYNGRAAFLSGLVLSTCFFFPQISRWMMLDSLFTLFFLLAIYGLYLGMNCQARQRLYFFLAAVFMACGTLTKGPIGFLPIPILFLYTIITRDLKKIWNWNLLYAILPAIGLVIVWFLPAVWFAGKAYGWQMLGHQIVGRFAEGWSHPEPFYFYLIRLPIGFLPWIIFFPWALHYGFSSLPAGKRKEFLFLFIWFSSFFLFFSLSKGKKDNYILPLYPAAAMLVGAWLSSSWASAENGKKRVSSSSIPLLVFSLFSLVSLIFLLLRDPQDLPRAVLAYRPLVLWPLFYISLGGILSCLFLLKKWSRLSLYCLIGSLIVSQVHLAILIPSEMNKRKSLKPFCKQILLTMGPEDELKIWKFLSTGILYYTDKPVEQIRTIDRLRQVFQSGRRSFVVVEAEDFSRLRSRENLPFHLVGGTEGLNRKLLLISNQIVPSR